MNTPVCVSQIGDNIDNIFCNIQQIFIMDRKQPFIAVIFSRKGKLFKAQYKEAYVDGVGIFLSNNV